MAVSCSIINKVFDLLPPVLIGLAVDVVVQQDSSWLATLGATTVPSQLIVLAVLSFLVWTAESLFEYLYGVLWRNLAQTTQHSLRLEAYDHLQKLEMDFFERDSTGRLLTVLGDDIHQLERFLERGANEILQLVTTVLLVGSAMTLLARRGTLRISTDPNHPCGITQFSTPPRSAISRRPPKSWRSRLSTV